MKDLIEKYAKGELSGKERNALEKEAMNDPFLADALEGMEMKGSLEALEGAREALPNLNPSKGLSWSKVLGGAAICTGLVLGLMAVLQEPESSSVSQTETPLKEEVIVDLKEEESTTEMQEEAEVIIEPERIEKVIVMAQAQLPEQKFEFEEEELEAIPYEEIEPIAKIEVGSDPIEPSGEKQKMIIRASNMELEYYHHLKVVDFSTLYRKSIRVDKSLNQGTPAYMEDQSTDNGVRIDFNEGEWVPYMEYLEPTMKHVAKGRNKLALKNFDIIFDNFPQDANAQFYAGLCNFYLERHDQAILHFDAVKENKINTFHEEADWHRLLSYKATNQKALFSMLKKDIVELGGFYAERAEGLDL